MQLADVVQNNENEIVCNTRQVEAQHVIEEA